jgi:hypothetical protein
MGMGMGVQPAMGVGMGMRPGMGMGMAGAALVAEENMLMHGLATGNMAEVVAAEVMIMNNPLV